MESLFDQIGLKIVYLPPLCKSGAGIRGSFKHEISSYSHETISIVGYWTADIGLIMNIKDAETWYSQCLGCQIRVYTKSGRVFEGFVNVVQVNAGAITETRGPLLDIGNRLSSAYTPVDFSVYPPVTGTETTTLITENLDSQAEFGIIEKVINAGQCTQATAEQVRDIQLQDIAWPSSSGPLSIQPGSAQMPAVTLNCLGNVHWLTAFVFEDINAGYIILSDKLQNVLSADPNNVISTDFTNIVANNFLVEQMDIKGRFGMDVITDLLNLGNDTDDFRRVFGIYNDRIAYYSTMPSRYEYMHRLSDPGQRILNTQKRIVYPWNVKPGKWLFVPDFMPGFIPPNTNMRSDPRLKFLESVRYSAPATLDLSGGKMDRLSQALAKITMNGGYL